MPRLILSLFLFAALLLDVSTAVVAQSVANGPKPAAHASPAAPVKLALPLKDGSVRFAAMGDSGTGGKGQQQVADMMVRYWQTFPFEFVVMMGDNMYGGESPKDFEEKFSDVYRPLLDGKVKFYASLGNHDLALQANYELFNMNGKEYYRFKKGNVAFYALNSNYMDKKQLTWLQEQLAADTSEWKVCFFHHAPYSSAKSHGSDDDLRKVLEPIFVQYGVNVVLTGHDHVYERVKPQQGIYYFVSGAAGKLRKGDIRRPSPLTDKAYDQDLHFMLFEVAGDQMYFQAVSRTGETVDAGVMARQKK
ncbi:MAG TPA: metallophosphoesterase [Pyrinomonadaceae bacterium]|nr:metallophosphoesterase [Pyrinomonadaceae bacterium]